MDSNLTDIEMSLSEHLEELRQRMLLSFGVFITATFLGLSVIKKIVSILQAPALGVKFLQLAPGEFFFTSVKVGIFFGAIIVSPFVIYQLFLFIIPGMTSNERQILFPFALSSGLLFFLGVIFSYFVLIPAALNFFINYGSDVVEPLWSFEQYLDFILVLLLSTGLCFQIPVIQIIAGLSGIISSSKMLSSWRYVILIATILGAILTPSTDPITQILLSSAILSLFFGGCFILRFLESESS
uniref:Sec-independent protein translocase component TatC n=1 Tax=Haptophyceae sp. NIES-3900 TaxID=2748608 RepID=A0A7R6WD47_9EUKA|nr:Sec-independent protein translocase component TatC [Haptophyceae sp. NIES-3900]